MRTFAAPFTSHLMLQWLGNVADCLKVRLHNKSSSKHRTGLIIAFLAHNYTVAGHTGNSNQAARRSPPGGMDGWA